MIPQTTPKTIRTWLPRVLEWSLLFLALLLAIWLVTREANAPQLILLLLLYIIAINFTLPPAYGSVGLVPVVAVGSVLVVGLETAVILTLISLTIAELARPLWNPMWDLVNLQRPSWAQRISNMALHLLALLSSGLIYRQLGGAAPLNEDGLQNILAFAGLAVGYGLSHFLLALLGQLIARRPLRSFLADNSLSILTASLLAQPFAIFGGITFVRSGLPIFVIFSLGVMLFSVVTWISWQRRFVAEQQLVQFGRLNDVSISLRETLELPVVLSRTHQHVTALVPADDFAISLCDDAGNWQRFQDDAHFEGGSVDDFTRWTAQQQRLLNLHRRNFHYAAQHQLALPQPTPTAWLGIPLMSGMQTTGVMVLQRFGNSQPFSRWNQEILSALAAQVSSAIENARLYSETLRLYNLTDEALARRVEQLQALLNTVQEGVLMLDTQGRVLLINPTAAALLAQPSTHMMNKVLDEETAVTHLGYTANEWQAQQTRLQNQQPPQGNGHIFPASLQPSDGAARRVTIERTEFAVYAQDGLVMGWLILLRDITEEQALAEQRSDVLRMIVHDLRNPVTTLLSTMRQAEQQLPPTTPDSIGELLQDGQQTCGDMLDMVDSLLDINRMEAGQLEPDAEAMRLPPLVEMMLKRLTPLARQRQITLHYHAAPDLPAIWADAEMVRRVLVNLLDNALKFTPAGGEITVTLAEEVADAAEPGVRCTISDTGPGIPTEFRERIFDRFLRTNMGGAQVRGTGLGLSFCKIAVEAHNGRIWAENGTEGGSQFVFTLPGIPQFDLE